MRTSLSGGSGRATPGPFRNFSSAEFRDCSIRAVRNTFPSCRAISDSFDHMETHSTTTSSVCVVWSCQQSIESCNLRTIAPHLRTDLTRIAASTLESLSKVSQVRSTDIALQLLSEKAALLKFLQSWLTNVGLLQTENTSPCAEFVSVSFLRLFRSILEIVLVRTLNSPPDLRAELQCEEERSMNIAGNLEERVRGYKTWSGTGGGRKERIPPMPCANVLWPDQTRLSAVQSSVHTIA